MRAPTKMTDDAGARGATATAIALPVRLGRRAMALAIALLAPLRLAATRALEGLRERWLEARDRASLVDELGIEVPAPPAPRRRLRAL
ncbi:MAG TPA: hypothetical protein VE987_00630 [Polyangiaceae bacterium]|nr:hypothetical protein [Polyangiaceae bacterium]